MHPDFGQPRRYSNDVALLKLKRPIVFNLLTQPICLPSPKGEDFEGWNATVVGWGWLDEENKGKHLHLILDIFPPPDFFAEIICEATVESSVRFSHLFNSQTQCISLREHLQSLEKRNTLLLNINHITSLNFKLRCPHLEFLT